MHESVTDYCVPREPGCSDPARFVDEFNFGNLGTCHTADGDVFTHLVTPEYVEEDPAVEYFFDQSGSLVAVRALVEGDVSADAWCCGGFSVTEIWYGEPLAITSCEEQPG